MRKNVIVTGAFGIPGSKEIRFFQEAAKNGNRLHVGILDDGLIEKLTGKKSEFPLSERQYFLENIRYVDHIKPIGTLDELNDIERLFEVRIDLWMDFEFESIIPEISEIVKKQAIDFSRIDTSLLSQFPEHDYDLENTSGKKVVVTGCFDLFHTGHVRFFEEASEFGDLYVILGHDKNIKLLKGPKHPLFSDKERQYVAGSIRFVKQALISSGEGWMDAEPEITKINPDCYVVNEDGDKNEKRVFCEQHGIEYVVLKRKPKPGLQGRSSTSLRGF